MVAANIGPATPDLIPAPPEWLQRQQQQKGANANRNVNDIYWRKPDGWIVVGPSAIPGTDGRPLTRQAESLIRKGWTPLIEYSYTDRVSPKTGQRETIETNADRLGTTDRYYWLFRNGGAHLFTIEQIVEHHWHLNPPYGLPKEVFPQLKEWEVPAAYWCPACAGNQQPRNSEEQVITHLMITHRMTLQQTRDMQESSRNFLERPVGSSGLAIRRKAQGYENSAEGEAIPASPDQPQSGRIICNACGESFNNYPARARHMKAEHASPEEGRED